MTPRSQMKRWLYCGQLRRHQRVLVMLGIECHSMVLYKLYRCSCVV
jgi:hypothetical protein